MEATNVVRFKSRKTTVAQAHPRSLMEVVYASGALSIPADDVATKMAAATLHAFGFFIIEEILADGTPRRLRRDEVKSSLHTRPWRVLKPGFATEAGRPEADGVFTGREPQGRTPS